MASRSLNELMALAAQAFTPMRGASSQTAMTTASTEYSLALVDRSRNNLLRMRDATKPWWWSYTGGVVVSGVGMQMGAGDALTIEGPIGAAVTVYFACGSALMTMDNSYEYPVDGP